MQAAALRLFERAYPKPACLLEAAFEKELPGFGEAQRILSFRSVPTAILSRATAGVRGRSLIINLPGNPKAIAECLPPVVPAIREALRHLAE